jgi:hypothetical protein
MSEDITVLNIGFELDYKYVELTYRRLNADV